MIMVSKARDNAHLTVRAPPFEMWPLRTMDEESLFAGTMPKSEANLSELWNLCMSPTYEDSRNRHQKFDIL